MEGFSEGFGAKIMLEAMKRFHPRDILLPSLSQLGALMHSCAGVLAATGFPVLIRHLKSLNPHPQRDREQNFFQNGSSKDIAHIC
jgi:hypothetical protein